MPTVGKRTQYPPMFTEIIVEFGAFGTPSHIPTLNRRFAAMSLKPPILDTQPQPFNDKADRIVSDMLDAAELALVRNGICQSHEADAYLTMDYIKECGTFLEHASFYVESEGRIAADLFLWRLSNASNGPLRARYNRHWRICALQLHWHTKVYFRGYLDVLRDTYLNLLAALPSVSAIDSNGVLKLAAANLPNVRTHIRRERRRRGADSDRLIIADADLDRRIKHINKIGIEDLTNKYDLKYLTDT